MWLPLCRQKKQKIDQERAAAAGNDGCGAAGAAPPPRLGARAHQVHAIHRLTVTSSSELPFPPPHPTSPYQNFVRLQRRYAATHASAGRGSRLTRTAIDRWPPFPYPGEHTAPPPPPPTPSHAWTATPHVAPGRGGREVAAGAKGRARGGEEGGKGGGAAEGSGAEILWYSTPRHLRRAGRRGGGGRRTMGERGWGG